MKKEQLQKLCRKVSGIEWLPRKGFMLVYKRSCITSIFVDWTFVVVAKERRAYPMNEKNWTQVKVFKEMK